jgi:hypothetical protein
VTDASYAPRRRTALVLAGAGTAGAYQAGVLRALHEAGVKIDVLVGRGVGVVTALFAAIDAGGELWGPNGLWRGRSRRAAYRFRPLLRLAAWSLGAALVVLLSPLALLALAVLASVGALIAGLVGAAPVATAVAARFGGLLERLFAPEALPALVPRGVALALVAVVVVLAGGAVASAVGRRRRVRGAPWWQMIDAPLSARPFVRRVLRALWRVVRGALPVGRPAPVEVGRRYVELLGENLGQPGFRELVLVVHDLDARRDLVFALLREPFRGRFFAGRAADGAPRSAEAFDLGGIARDHVIDAVGASLALPVATSAWPVTFAAESYWRGETHRLCDRPGGVSRLLLEAMLAGAEQLVVVSDAPPPSGPHRLEPTRADWRGLAGDVVRAIETAAIEDALAMLGSRGAAVYLIRPAHNPVGPFDLGGTRDEASDRRVSLDELVARGYEDAYRQFIEPVVAAGGDPLAAPSATRRGAP